MLSNPMHDQVASTMQPPQMYNGYQPASYPTGHHADLFARIVQAHHKETQVPLSLCIQAALSIGSFVQQGILELQAPSGHITSASLITIGTFPPALGKSTIIERFTAPINDFMQSHEQARKEQYQEYTYQQKIWEKTYQKLIERLSSVKTQGLEKQAKGEEEKYQKAVRLAEKIEVALTRHIQEKPQPPVPTGLKILGDVTPAGLSQAISQEHIRSLAIISSEAEEFLTKGIQQHSAILNKGFSGEKTQRHLATRGDESHHIPITTLLFGQPTVMEKAFGGKNNRLRGTGTMARCLFTSPQGLPGSPYSASNQSPSTDTEQAKDDYYHWVQQMLADNEALFAANGPRKKLQLADDATEMWHQQRQAINQQIVPNGRYAQFADHARRLPEQWLRVALVLHGYNNPQHSTVSAQTLQLAINMVDEFSREFVAIFYQPSQQEQDCQKLFEWCLEKLNYSRFVSRRQVKKMFDWKPAGRIDQALEMLASQGYIACFPYSPLNPQGKPLKSVAMIDLRPGTWIGPGEVEQTVNYLMQTDQL